MSEPYELPNVIQLLHKIYPNKRVVTFLYQWENLFFSLCAAFLVALLFYCGFKAKRMIPKGWQNFVESILETLQRLILGVLGEEGKKNLPFLGTLFIYILSMNWLGLIPFLKTPSSNINTTAALALCVFVYVQYLNIKNMGFFGFLYHMAGSPRNLISWLLVPILLPLEILTQLARPVTLALRLFGNMFGEHILMGVFALMGVIWVLGRTIPIPLPLQIPFSFFALLTGLMQALVFTMLSTVYIFLSIPHRKEK